MVHNHMAGAESSVCNFSLDSAIRGYYYYIYKFVWNPAIGDILICKRESGNDNDRFAVAVSPLEAISESMIVGHIPQVISRICWYFLIHEGSILCEVVGQKRIPQIYYKEGWKFHAFYIFGMKINV